MLGASKTALLPITPIDVINEEPGEWRNRCDERERGMETDHVL